MLCYMIVIAWLSVTNCMNYIHDRMYIGNDDTRVRKHNLRGLEKHTEHDNSEIKLNCISGWKFAPLRQKGMNGVVHVDKVY